MNPYTVLGVGREATPDEIKAAFRRRSRENHPDKGGDEGAFRSIREAFDVLKDPELRAGFDATGRVPMSEGGIRAEAAKMLRAIFDRLIDSGRIVADLRAALVKEVEGIGRAAANAEEVAVAELARMEEYSDRLAGDGAEVFDGVGEGKIEALMARKDEAAATVRMTAVAAKILEGIEDTRPREQDPFAGYSRSAFNSQFRSWDGFAGSVEAWAASEKG